MVEDDTFTYHVKQLRREQANPVAHSLITKERTQKLDLLIHLLSNLTQALVVCGPKGIGKSTLLNVLQERNAESWRYCLVQGNAELSFEAIVGQLDKIQPGWPLSKAFGRQEGQSKQVGLAGRIGSRPLTALPPTLAVVLIIDDAGDLVPGLITAIIQYAAANPDLRVVFALTHDELQVKRGSDRTVDDCHIVEIPPLSERQSGDFLRDLSANPALNLSFNAIGENMITHIYRETHGVPGRIIAEVSGLSVVKQNGKLKWVVVIAVTAAIVITVGVQWLAPPAITPASPKRATLTTLIKDGDNAALMQSPKNNSKVVAPPAFVEQKVGDIDMARPQPEPLIMLKVPTEGSGDDASRSLIPTPSTEVRSAAIVKTEQLKEVVQIREPVPPIAQPVISVQEHSALANAKDVLEAAADLNTSVRDRQAATPSVLPEAVIKHSEKPFDSTPQKSTESLLGGKSELTKTESLIPKSEAIKAQVEPAILVDQKLGKKQVEIAQQKLVDPPVSKQEKLRLKQQELKEFIDSVERFKPDSPGTRPLAQKPVEVVAIPKAKDIETLVPQQVAPEQPLAQTANVFTLQLMVLSKQSSVDDLLKKYPEMSSGLRSIQTVANGQQRFILEYGSYPDTASANKARQSLPPEFGHALVRKIHR